MKKLFCLLIGIVMLITLCPSYTYAETEQESSDTGFLSSLREQYINCSSSENNEVFGNLSFNDEGIIYSKYEIKFSLNLDYTNPFDPEDITVNGVFTKPDGSVAVIPAFYAVDMKYKDADTTLMTYNANLYSPEGDGYWCVRFSGDTQGDYSFYLEAITRDNTVYRSNSNSFSLKYADRGGFIDISDSNSAYFVDTADNSLFYGSGANTAWVRSQFTQDASHLKYEYFLGQAAEAGVTLTRVWLCHWAWLEWLPREGYSETYSYAGLGYYNQCISSALDNIFKICEENDIRLVLTLDDNNEHGNAVENDSPTYDSWSFNPYNAENGGPALNTTEYFSNSEVRRHYKNRLRYIIARWGYSTSLMSLNLWNDTTTPTDDITDYLSELNGYTDSLTENYRPLLFASNYKYEANNVLDYITQNSANGNAPSSKPVLTQECYYSEDKNYFRSTLKNTLWDELFSFGAGAMVWSHDTVDETDSWGLFTGILNFTNKLPLERKNYLPNYSVSSFASTWENGGVTPTLKISNGKLYVSTCDTTFSYATVKLDSPVFDDKTTGISFWYDTSELSENTYFRINLTTKVSGVTHTYMPWFSGEYYFTPDGGETQSFTVSGNKQFSSWLHIPAGQKGTVYIPFSTLTVPQELLSDSSVSDTYKYDIYSDKGQSFSFVIQQGLTPEGYAEIALDNISWIGEEHNITAQNFAKHTASLPLSARYLSESGESFKTITAKALGDVSGWQQKATENKFYINENDSDLLLAGISPKLYGSNKNITEYKNDPTFTVTCTSGGEMVIELSEYGSGTNYFTVTKNGEQISSHELSGGRKYVTDEQRYISVPLDAGTNTITLSNTGSDWIHISGYHFKFYTENPTEFLSVKRMISDNQQLALIRNSKNGEIYQKVFFGLTDTALDVEIPFYELSNGVYRLEIIDTESGSAELCELVTVTDNSFVATISEIIDTKAIKLTKFSFGDANEDNTCNILDLIRIKKHISGRNGVINFDNSDTDLNGSLDISDLVKLRLHLLEN